MTLDASARHVRFDVTFPWEQGVRFKLPAITIAVDSVASNQRLLYSGGPTSVYCPAGSGLPQAVPLGYYSVSTLLLNESAPSSRQPATFSVSGGNMTRDAVRVAEAGHYAVAGILYPCNAGRFGSSSGASSAACSGWCPPAFYCPLASVAPQPCPPGSFAVGGAETCTPCSSSSNGGNADSTSASRAVPLNAALVNDAWPEVLGDAPGRSTLPRSPSLGARCQHARYCCDL
ncbi:MAG: hypothetical protein EOO41_03195 [Methanobacteriota archaeon]|nr:MAG: hypothetical protein EOO41_03195 [Euryarchaeota archaeon]